MSDKELLQGLLRYEAEDRYSYPISKAVGNVRNQVAAFNHAMFLVESQALTNVRASVLIG
ncbi:hypothetical protein [Paenibacillus cineris]|uniref:hypothetical protein n=1 Tax=Paenibacillus cineris TaxID=237530 RepID=UPI001AFD608C|nr:hypothetical protein [Paenibacillus cineris]GIO64930.1 hypothetical protein J43TS9_65040 [Paenibacillus cineris]